jgi:ribosome-binding protein aMBF1 (putative translation factor)
MEEPMSNTPADEVPDVLVLAAIDRAERHGGRATKGVPVWEVLAHLDVVRRTRRARHVRELVQALVVSGSLQRSRRRGVPVWALTSGGRRRLSRARRANRVPVLPESPQHRRWREAHTLAEQRIEGFCFELRDAVEHAQKLLDALAPGPSADGPGVGSGLSSDVWFELAEQLQRAGRRLGSASYCLWEWREPDDAQADVDDLSAPYDKAFDPRRREVRRARRGGRRNTLLWDSGPELVFLGQAIREAREEHELSVDELAAKAGIPARRLARLEAGQLDPGYDLLLKLADALSTTPSTFAARAQAHETKEQSR